MTGGQKMDAFLEALTAGENKIPRSFDWFAPLLGDWDFTYTDGLGGGRTVQGEWLFRRALNGAGIEDLFIAPPGPPGRTTPSPTGSTARPSGCSTPNGAATTWPTAARAMCVCSPS